MPYGEPDPEDPNVLVGVMLPGQPDSMREMAVAFVEEFVALGFDEQRVMALFRRPFYSGAHQALKVLGEPEIRRIIQETLRVWGGYRIAVKDAPDSETEDGVCPA